MKYNFEVKVRVNRVQQNDLVKNVNETYLVNANSFGESENVVCTLLSQQQTEYEVKSVRISGISEVIGHAACEGYFLVTAVVTTLTDRGSEKKVKCRILVGAGFIDEVRAIVLKEMDVFGDHYHIDSIKESAIIEYITTP